MPTAAVGMAPKCEDNDVTDHQCAFQAKLVEPPS